MVNSKERGVLFEAVQNFRINNDVELKLLNRNLAHLYFIAGIPYANARNFTDVRSNIGILTSHCELLMAASDVTASEYKKWYQCMAYLKKYPLPGDDKTCTETALTRFQQAESQCRETNISLRNADSAFVKKVRKTITDVLGPLTPAKKLQILNLAVPSGGQTSNREAYGGQKTTQTTLPFKYSQNLDCTASALPYVKYVISKNEHHLHALYNKVTQAKRTGPTSRIFRYVDRRYAEDVVFKNCIRIVTKNWLSMVPKDCTTHRMIGMEPCGNVMIQRGVGKYFKKCLHKVGINLYDQSINQKLAKLGSKTGLTATIDLAMASDTVAKYLVQLVFPRDWWLFLCELRSPSGTSSKRLGLEVEDYEKFSSMGNGFTFELESLIFYAITYNASEEDPEYISVYGDDIICKSKHAKNVIRRLRECGFETNKDKTFISGKFRESCGADYYDGHDVRPLFLKRRVKNVYDLNFSMNRIAYHMLDKKYNEVLNGCYTQMFKFLPKELIIPGPLTFSLSYDERGKKGLDTPDLEVNLKLPLSAALTYKQRVQFQTQQGTVSYCSVKLETAHILPQRCGTALTVGHYLSFLKGGSGKYVELRDGVRNGIRKRMTPLWSSFPTDVLVTYGPSIWSKHESTNIPFSAERLKNVRSHLIKRMRQTMLPGKLH